MVIYGRSAEPGRVVKSAKCIHGGAAFVLPLVQSYQYLDLTPISIQVDLTNALSRQNIRIDVLLASRSVSRPSRGLCRTRPSACWGCS